MNFTDINLDLQSTMRKIYADLLYRSNFMNMVNRDFLQVARTETPVIEVIKALPTSVRERNKVELTKANSLEADRLNPTLASYDSVKVDLTELRMDYSFMVSPLVMGSGIAGAIDNQIALKDSEIAKKVDTYGFNKLAKAINGSADGSQAYTKGRVAVWNPSTKDDYIDLINELSADLFDVNVYEGYICGLKSSEYAKLVSALTSVLKFETRAGIEAVDMGKVANAYGIDFFQINSNVLTNNEIGYFGHEVGTVGDFFFSAFNTFDTYQGLPGYFVAEGNAFFGADVVRSEALIKLVESVPVVTAGTFDSGKVGTTYSQTTAFSGTGSVKFEGVGVPAGLSLGETTGALTGTPTEAGKFEVAIYGIDTDGNYSNAFSGTIEIAE